MAQYITGKTPGPQEWSEGISIIVPTFRRPEGLRTALESLRVQSVENTLIELIVADNDPQASAQLQVATFAEAANFPVRYIHVPEPGVANARNAALKAAQGRYLAFLDDDQFARGNWLHALLDVMKQYDAGLAFCPTHARSPVDVQFKTECLNFFTRDIQKAMPGPVDDFFGCGNSLLDTHKCILPSPPFSLATNETGGEDDLLFQMIKDQGVTIVWTDKTSVGENVEDWRMSHKYIAIRSFGYGQGPSRLCAAPNTLDLKGLIRWSAIGTAQVGVYAPMAFLCLLLGNKRYIPFMRKASEGAGKVLWYERFRPRLYGATALKNQLQREESLQKDNMNTRGVDYI